MDRRKFLALFVGGGIISGEIGLTAYNLASSPKIATYESEPEQPYPITCMYELIESANDRTKVLRWFQEFQVMPANVKVAGLAVSSWLAEAIDTSFGPGAVDTVDARFGIVDADVTFTFDSFYLPNPRMYNNAVYQLGNVFDMKYVLDTLDTPSGRVARQQSDAIATLIAKTPRHRFFV